MKDHEKRELISELVGIARIAHGAEQLRDRIAYALSGVFSALDEATARAERAEAEIAELEQDAERYRILCQESLTCWREGNGVGLVIPQQWHSEAQELKEHCDECVDAFIEEVNLPTNEVVK